MSDDVFDPYHKWLGIPPHEQPPDHYRLLGITRFEPDADVIANAADQRMAHVRTFQAGKHGPLSQRILNEIATARVCLLNAEKKRQYDLELQGQQAPTATPGSHGPVLPPPAPPVIPPFSPLSPGYSPSVRSVPVGARPRSGWPWVLFGGVALCALVAVWALWPRSEPPQAIAPPSENHQSVADPLPPADPKPGNRKAPDPGQTTKKATKTPAPVEKKPEKPESIAPPPDNPEPPEKRVPATIVRGPVPPAGSRQLAQSELAGSITGRSSEELRQAATDPSRSPAERYVLLEQAAQAAVLAGDADLAVQAIDETGRQFEIELPQRKVETILAILEKAQGDRQYRDLVGRLLDALEGFQGERALAVRAATQALAAARKSGSADLVRRATLRLVELQRSEEKK